MTWLVGTQKQVVVSQYTRNIHLHICIHQSSRLYTATLPPVCIVFFKCTTSVYICVCLYFLYTYVYVYISCILPHYHLTSVYICVCLYFSVCVRIFDVIQIFYTTNACTHAGGTVAVYMWHDYCMCIHKYMYIISFFVYIDTWQDTDIWHQYMYISSFVMCTDIRRDTNIWHHSCMHAHRW